MKNNHSSSRKIFLLSLLFSAVLIVSGHGRAQAVVEDNAPRMIKGAKYVGTESCVMCHEKEAKEFELSTHSRVSNDKAEGEAQGCEMCHGPGSIHVDASGGK